MGTRLLAAATLLILLCTAAPGVNAAPGVSKTVIKIGLHAPLTGSSPVPSDSVDKAKDLYFRWLKSKGRDINGRDVQVVLKNDQGTASGAVSACKDLVQQDHVFMIFGISGADPIKACARYTASVGVPYVGPGTMNETFKGLATFFATTMTWPRQARLLADYFVSRANARSRKNGMLTLDKRSYFGVLQAFTERIRARKADLQYDRRIDPSAGTSEARTVVQEMKVSNIGNVFVLTNPVWFLQVLNQANTQGFMPAWMGIDSGIAHDTVLGPGCQGGNSFNDARFLSAVPAVIDSDRFDPNFRRAMAQLEPSSTPDDYMWRVWAIDRVIAKMLDRTGARPTRDRFVHRVERTDRIHTGISPNLHYTPNDHFGASSTHVLRADCSDQRWHTAATFKRRFGN
ncbi:MAG: branched-chain amino acid transport system substrate-binding protein [Actinomycetota bacterium]|jgi:ABC-type branched-subunit amino acid transport system substrate-binding protein|nr:branched-chain amino acid transport system substrate-binding protein [Actinomycetota bacterium]